MNAFSWLVLACVAICAALAVRAMRRAQRRGGCGACAGGCAACPQACPRQGEKTESKARRPRVLYAHGAVFGVKITLPVHFFISSEIF